MNLYFSAAHAEYFDTIFNKIAQLLHILREIEAKERVILHILESVERTTVCSVICCIIRLNHSYWERNVCLNINNCKCLISNSTNMNHFHPLEVVDRGSKTQLQADKNVFCYCRAIRVNSLLIFKLRLSASVYVWRSMCTRQRCVTPSPSDSLSTVAQT